MSTKILRRLSWGILITMAALVGCRERESAPTPGAASGSRCVDFYGAHGDGITPDDEAFAQAFAHNASVIELGPGKTYLLTRPIVVPASKSVRGIVCSDAHATIRFQNIPRTQDCITFGGVPANEVVLRNLTLDGGNGRSTGTCGRDLVVIKGSAHPVLEHLYLGGAQRDGLVVDVSHHAFVQKLSASDLFIEDSGRNAIRLEIGNDASGSFINECRWEMIEIRGLALRYDGGCAIFAKVAGTNPGAKISQHTFEDVNIDGRRAESLRNGHDLAPYIVHCIFTPGATNNFELWRFLGGGWESTSGPWLHPAPSPNNNAMIFVDDGAFANFWEVRGISISNWTDGGIHGLANASFQLPTMGGAFGASADAVFTQKDTYLRSFSTRDLGVTTARAEMFPNQSTNIVVAFPITNERETRLYELNLLGARFPDPQSGTHWARRLELALVWNPTGDHKTWLIVAPLAASGHPDEMPEIADITLVGPSDSPTAIRLNIRGAKNAGLNGGSRLLLLSLSALGQVKP